MTEVKGFFYPRTAGGRSSLIPSPPWYYSGDLLTVEYRTDPARVAELLPAPLELAAGGPRRRGAHLGRLAVLLEQPRGAARPGAVAVQGGVRGRPLQFQGQTYSRCVYIWVDKDFAIGRGIHQGYPKKLGSMWQTRPHPFAQGAPQIGAGGVFGATLAAGDRRLAEAVLTLREESETNGFVNAHKMAHHRIFPGIEAGAPDAYAELIESGASEFEAGPAWTGDVELRLFDSPTEELSRLDRRRDHRRLLPPGGRRLERRPVAGDADPAGRGCRGDPMSSKPVQSIGADFASVEDVSVDTRHWIGGQRVASAEHIRRHLTDRRDRHRRGARRGPAGGRRCRRGGAGRLPGVGRAARRRAGRAPARGRGRRRQAGRGPVAGRDPRQRLAAALAPAWRDAAGRR